MHKHKVHIRYVSLSGRVPVICGSSLHSWLYTHRIHEETRPGHVQPLSPKKTNNPYPKTSVCTSLFAVMATAVLVWRLVGFAAVAHGVTWTTQSPLIPNFDWVVIDHADGNSMGYGVTVTDGHAFVSGSMRSTVRFENQETGEMIESKELMAIFSWQKCRSPVGRRRFGPTQARQTSSRPILAHLAMRPSFR